jgi:hypothetical protein
VSSGCKTIRSSGARFLEYGHWQLRELVDKWNRVLYRLLPDAIEIVTVVPARVPLDLDPGND